MSSYKGMLQHINGLHLWQTVTGMNKFSDFNLNKGNGETTMRDDKRFFNVQAISCEFLTDKKIEVLDFEDDCETKNGKRMFVLVNDNGKKYKFCTNNPQMKKNLHDIRELDGFPFETIITMTTLNNGIKDYSFN